MFVRFSSLLFVLSAPAMMLAAQTSPAASTSVNTTTARAPLPSATLQSSLDVLQQALAELTIDKWKASPAIRAEAAGNLNSIQRDLQKTLPNLLSSADAAPDSTAKTLPVFRNVDALYDVVLRLDAAARLAAPKEQMSALDQALSGLSDVRRTFGDQVQTNAEAQESRMIHLQAALKTVPPPPPPPTPVACTPPTPAKKKKVTKPASTASSPTTTPSH